MNRSDRLTRTASVAYTKGLLNHPGENNCFLNSAVQVLFHLDVFRRSFREISGHFCVGESCIFCALKVIFTQIQYSDEAALPPDALRQALAVTFKDQQRFQLQDMDDAAECLENILNRLHFHFAMNEKDEICSAQHCISHRKFAMEIMEQTICNCGATSEPLPFSQLVHYVSVSALCREADVLSGRLKGLNQDMFGYLLKKAVNQGEPRTCPGINCDKKISVQQSLLNCPDVVCIGLIWDSESPDVEQITQLLDCIDPVLRLHEVFPRVVDDRARKGELLLAGVVTYYGKHYSTFFYSNRLSTWFYFDDATVRKCGPEWETIRDKCCQNHYQPLLLLYVNPHGRPVSAKTAPSEVKVVDTKTLLASQENNRSRTSFSSEKTSDRIGGTLSVLHEHNSNGDVVDGLLSSSSSHSVSSDRGSEKGEEPSSPDRKKDKRPLKKLRVIGSDIKRALSRSRPSSPTQEQNNVTSDTKSALSRSRNNSPVRLSDVKTTQSRSRKSSPAREHNRIVDPDRTLTRNRNNSPSRERTMSTGSFRTEKNEKNVDQKKQASCEDLISFGDDPKGNNTRRVYGSTSSRGREIDEVDSGVGSSGSQPSSPATSSVSSVDTTTDDLIDFSSKTSTFPRGNDIKLDFESVINDAESLLRRSHVLEKEDLALSLSLATNAATRFRIAMENCPPFKRSTYLPVLKDKHNACLERSRNLHRQINERNNNAMTTTRFSQQEKKKLIDSQRERDQQVLKEIVQAPPTHGTLPRSSVKDALQVNEVVPMSSQAVNGHYFNNRSDWPSNARRTSSRTIHSGTMGSQRDEVNCTQKIKPDVLCYSPVHYGKTNGLSNDLERLNLAHGRNPTVTHASTSYIPVPNLPVDQILPTSTVLPNSRNLRNTDIRRCSIYDNMPPSGVKDAQMSSSYPQRNGSSLYPNSRPRSEAGDNRRSWSKPVYVDPPPYNSPRTTQANSRNQSGNLLHRFNVPNHSQYSETRSVPEDVRWINESVRNSRKLCSHCGRTFVEKNASYCQPCQDLNYMLSNLHDTAMQY